MRTKSEELLEQFCAHNNLAFRQVDTGSSSTPDYELTTVDGHVVVVEVKQLDRDDERSVEGEARVHTTVPGEHIRRKINKAGIQLRTRAINGDPTILLVYNNIYPGICIYSEPYDFLVAMYGLQTIVLCLPHAREPYVKGERFGGKRKMTNDANTSFSALARLREDRDGSLFMDVFHNAYALTPLAPHRFYGKRIAHFSVPKGSVEFCEWQSFPVSEEIPP